MRRGFFSVRVYGIWINNENKILVSDEFVGKKFLTKFPGGGVEFGEGLKDALKREWKEELDAEIIVKDHFYTTDFFQTSVFNPRVQIISAYYFIEPETQFTVKIRDRAFDFDILRNGAQSFRLLDIKTTDEESITLPIDKKVFQMIKEKY